MPGRGGRPDELELGRQLRKGDRTQVRTPVLPSVSEGPESYSQPETPQLSNGEHMPTAWLLMTLSEMMCGAHPSTAPSALCPDYKMTKSLGSPEAPEGLGVKA